MRRAMLPAIMCLLAALPGGAPAQDKKPVKKPGTFTSAAEAGPDFLIQGEYEGEAANDKGKYGAQVVALGDGKFDVYILKGGLPGAGWDGKTRSRAPAMTADGKTTISGDWTGTIASEALAVEKASDATLSLRRVERKSPTLGQAPPPGADVLFDGKNIAEWQGGKLVEDNLLFCGTRSKKRIGTGKLHLEFRTPFQPKARGQGRGNSGVYIHGSEVQVLDSFGLTGAKDECGALYGARRPDVNMCLPPLSWQTYDVELKPGSKENELRATVWHNGVKVHEDIATAGSAAKPATINLQDHGNPVVYRNIWFLPTAQK